MTLVPLRLATDGFFTSQLVGENTLNPATLNAIRDSVWTAVLSQYQSAGTAGAKLTLASTLTAGDIPAAVGLSSANLDGQLGDITALVL